MQSHSRTLARRPRPAAALLALGVAGTALASPPVESIAPTGAPGILGAQAATSIDVTTIPDLNGVARPARFGSVHASASAADTFDGEPLVQDPTSGYYMDDDQSNSFLFDDQPEIGGVSLLDPAVVFAAAEASTDLGGTTLIQVEMGAYDEEGFPTLWVDSAATGIGLEAWRFDVGAGAAGGDLIDLQPGQTLTVVASGMIAFDSAGAVIGEFDLLTDDSTATGIGGVGLVGLGGADIAGFDLSALQLWWEIEITEDTGEPGGCLADVNGDGYLDFADMSLFVNAFINNCR